MRRYAARRHIYCQGVGGQLNTTKAAQEIIASVQSGRILYYVTPDFNYTSTITECNENYKPSNKNLEILLNNKFLNKNTETQKHKPITKRKLRFLEKKNLSTIKSA